jgi:hypothetical protein
LKKALPPIILTGSGIVTEVMPELPQKALPPMVFTGYSVVTPYSVFVAVEGMITFPGPPE